MELASVHYDPFLLYEDPYPVFRALRDRAPVYHNEERDLWALSRFADVQAAGRDWEAFSNAHGIIVGMSESFYGPGDFLDSDPPRHDDLRNVVREAFIPKAIAALEAEVREEAAALVAQCAEQGEADLALELAWALPIAIICRLLGIPVEDRMLVHDWTSMVLSREPGDADMSPAAREAGEAMRTYFSTLAAERRRRSTGDLISTIANAEVRDRPLSDQEVEGMCLLIVTAGMETTAGLISNSLLLLDQHRDQRAMLVADPSLIRRAVEEFLRYESPIVQLGRMTTRDVEMHDEVIPAGSWVTLLYASANRDERRFEDPDRLDVTREPKRHLAFGEGIHFCLGAPLARLEGRIALEEILRRHPEYAVTGEPRRTPYLTSRGLSRLPATLG